MKNYLLIYIIVLVIQLSFVTNANLQFFPNLPAGEYKFSFKAILQCSPMSDSLKFNCYISKKSANTTEVKGNVTSTIVFDDSIDIEINMAVKDSIGGWKDNANLYRSPNACTVLKWFSGKAWISILNSFSMNITDCRLLPGVYKTTGLDTSIYTEQTHIPKVMFYGSYKTKFLFTRNKKVLGCFIAVMDIKRPWEME